MTLLFITTGNNHCLNFLKKQKNEYIIHVLDLTKDIINNKKDLELQIRNINPDLILVYRCPYILSKNIYSSAQYGAYNIHPSGVLGNAKPISLERHPINKGGMNTASIEIRAMIMK